MSNKDNFLNYRNDFVIKCFQRKYKISTIKSNQIFVEMLKYLYLGNIAQEQKLDIDLSIYDEMIVIDEMWHTFILCTTDYVSFCNKYTGGYIHHEPTIIDKTRKEVFEPLEISSKKYQRMLETILENFGEDTLNTWFVKYKKNYSKEKLKSLQQSL